MGNCNAVCIVFRFQAKGMDVGLGDELDGVQLEPSTDDDQYDDDDAELNEDDADIDLIRAKRAQRERPLTVANMNDIKSKFETGHTQSKEERREERKQEIQSIRSRLFMGKQAKIKEMYQQAVADSEQGMYGRVQHQEMSLLTHQFSHILYICILWP